MCCVVILWKVLDLALLYKQSLWLCFSWIIDGCFWPRNKRLLLQKYNFQTPHGVRLTTCYWDRKWTFRTCETWTAGLGMESMELSIHSIPDTHIESRRISAKGQSLGHAGRTVQEGNRSFSRMNRSFNRMNITIQLHLNETLSFVTTLEYQTLNFTCFGAKYEDSKQHTEYSERHHSCFIELHCSSKQYWYRLSIVRGIWANGYKNAH